MMVLIFAAGLIVGLGLAGLIWQLYIHPRYGRKLIELEWSTDRIRQLEDQTEQLNDKLRSETADHAATRERLGASQASRQSFTDAFKALADEALKSNNKAFIELANQTLQALLNQAKGDIGKQREQIDSLVKPLKEALTRYGTQTQQMEKDRAEAFGSLREYLDRLSEQTTSLETSLRRPEVRGQWGELTLRRVFEFAGLTEDVHYSLQVSVNSDDRQRLRPDAVVNLPGQVKIVIDAKAPLTAYQQAANAEDEETRRQAMQRHAQLVREHVKMLSGKSYFEQFADSPPFVILFLPGDGFFMAALREDFSLLEFASQRNVMLTGPSTLIPLLKTVAFAWQQQRLADNAENISQLGRDLYERMRVLVEHLEDIGKAVNNMVTAYNKAAGSLETRILPAARRFKQLGAGTDKDIPTLDQITTSSRSVPQLDEPHDEPNAAHPPGQRKDIRR